ncbi:MAG: type II toxin-antitoxin system RelE/ParE family toxin [Candidatus Gracilibacteria bacterium]
MYKIIFKKTATKEFLSLPAKLQAEVEEKLTLLSIGREELLDIKILSPKEDKRYRLRVGKYRVIYKIEQSELIICVIKIGSRGDVYK